MPFKKGEPRPANAGRRKGSLNKVGMPLKEMILAALEAKGGQAWLEAQMDENATAFCTLLGKVLPTTLTGPNDGPIKIESQTPEQRAAEAVSLIDETFGLVMGVSPGTGTVQ